MEFITKTFWRYGLIALLFFLGFLTIIGGMREAEQNRYQYKCIQENQEGILETQRIIKEQQETILRVKKALVREMEIRDEEERKRAEKGGP